MWKARKLMPRAWTESLFILRKTAAIKGCEGSRVKTQRGKKVNGLHADLDSLPEIKKEKEKG